jgi:peptidoglycan/xylan/chitin deacetylase (PgdA/CDA1 family)
MVKERFILLTFDVEEFDIPLEYGIEINPEEQMRVGKIGLDSIDSILKDKDIECTLFTTANFANHYPLQIAEYAQQHEIASHTYFHSTFEKEDLKNSLDVLEKITSKKVTGLRMPRMKTIDEDWIKDAGYLYNSSINPTWIPGRYNHFFTPRNYYKKDGLITFPVSVTPNFRIPLFWLAFKNFPYAIFKSLAIQTLKRDGYLSLYFHPWEFTDLSNYQLPAMVKRKHGNELLDQLNNFIGSLKSEGEFVSIQSFLKNKQMI